MTIQRYCQRYRLFLVFVWLQSSWVQAQVGTTFCACQPASYQFTLDFSLSCDALNVDGPGVNNTRCLERGTDETPDVTPIVVNTFQILELDQDLEPIVETSRRGEFLSGSNISYTSVITELNSSATTMVLPKGITIIVTGRNSENVSIVSSTIVVFNNNCTVYPVLEVGQTLGWTVLVSSIC
jgi:hypothetical protein